jgi:hypothetical protein
VTQHIKPPLGMIPFWRALELSLRHAGMGEWEIGAKRTADLTANLEGHGYEVRTIPGFMYRYDPKARTLLSSNSYCGREGCITAPHQHNPEVLEAFANAHRPTDAAARKALPICSGVMDYFPDALLAVAHCSKVGNDQHNPGRPLHWAKEKSTDESDALLRHMLDRGTVDTDGVRHSAKVAWRALAMLQREIEKEQEEHRGSAR